MKFKVGDLIIDTQLGNRSNFLLVVGINKKRRHYRIQIFLFFSQLDVQGNLLEIEEDSYSLYATFPDEV